MKFGIQIIDENNRTSERANILIVDVFDFFVYTGIYTETEDGVTILNYNTMIKTDALLSKRMTKYGWEYTNDVGGFNI